jgi:hypothetical protein
MLFKEIITVYTKNTLCGQNAELLNVKAGGTHIVTTVNGE